MYVSFADTEGSTCIKETDFIFVDLETLIAKYDDCEKTSVVNLMNVVEWKNPKGNKLLGVYLTPKKEI